MSDKNDQDMMIVLGQIAEGVQRMESDISTLRDGQQRMESDISSLKEGQREIVETLDEHTRILEEHSKIQEYIRDDYSVKNKQRLDKLEPRVEALEVVLKN